MKVKINRTILILTKVFFIYNPKFVILAWTGDVIWCGQSRGWSTHTDTQTDTQTDGGNDNTRRPKLASSKTNFNTDYLYNSMWKSVQYLTRILKQLCCTHIFVVELKWSADSAKETVPKIINHTRECSL